MKTIKAHLNLFEYSPIPTAILYDNSLCLDLANDQMLKLWGRPESVSGMNLLDFMPEMGKQPYPEIMKQVLKTGKTYHEKAAKLFFKKGDRIETVFVDHSYVPLRGKDHKNHAVMIMATDVTEKETYKRGLDQAARNLRSLVMSSPVPMCVFKGRNYEMDMINDHMQDLWLNDQLPGTAVLDHVFHNGVPYSLEHLHMKYTYTPFWDGVAGINRIVVVGKEIALKY